MWNTILSPNHKIHGIVQHSNELEKFKRYYLAVLSPSHNFWKDERVIDYLDDLRSIGVSQHIPVIFSLLDKYKKIEDTNNKIWPLYATFIRRVIAKKNPNEFERELSNICKKIKKENFNEVKKILDKLNPNDNEIMEALNNYEFKGSKDKHLAKAILRIINNKNLQDVNTIKDLTLEHIFPVSMSNNLDDESFVNKIGNLTLLPLGENKKLGNKSFKQKLKIFKISDLPINKELEEKEEWKDKDIAVRTKKLSDELCKVLK